MEPDEHVATIRDWLAAPATDAGVYFAEEGDGWEYRSYAELAELSWSIAALMRERGLPGGAGVCVIMPTGFPCAAAFYAVWACGGIFTPVAPPLFGDLGQYIAHVAAILEQAQPRLVVTSVEFADLARQAHAAAGRTDEPLVVDPATLPAAGEREFSDPDECALLQFTSGSTGTPRGVRVSWPNLATNVGMISRLVDWRPGEAMVSWLPLYHDMGLVGAFLTTVTNQGDLYLMRPDQFVRDPARWLRAMTKAQHSPSPSFAHGYVAHRVRAEEIAGLDLSGWRTLAVGSEPVELADLRSFAALTGPLGFSTRAYTLVGAGPADHRAAGGHGRAAVRCAGPRAGGRGAARRGERRGGGVDHRARLLDAGINRARCRFGGCRAAGRHARRDDGGRRVGGARVLRAAGARLVHPDRGRGAVLRRCRVPLSR